MRKERKEMKRREDKKEQFSEKISVKPTRILSFQRGTKY